MKLEFIFAFFAVLAIIDKICGNRFKLGDEFDRGISTAGPLILSMSGMIVLAPVLADVFSFVFRPVLDFFHLFWLHFRKIAFISKVSHTCNRKSCFQRSISKCLMVWTI